MPTIRVVTDSTCDLPAALIQQYGITVIPVSVQVGADHYLDRVTITTDSLLRRLAAGEPVATQPPSVAVFEQVYSRLQADRPCDGILSIHVAGSLSATGQAALTARDGFSGRTLPMAVIDSQSASLGLGLIVLAAARCAAAGGSWTAVQHEAQRMRGQAHIAFYVDTVEPLLGSGRLGKAVAPADALLNSKPLLRLDEGRVVLLERTRTRHKALDLLAAFVEDFPTIADLALLYGTYTPDLDSLLTRLSAVYPRERILLVQYSPANAVYLGPTAVGIAVSEG
ncbi:MAG: DegV family protein [Chloroflexota bacterium]|nr:DegV family protein [Chloroflexota bacterium]